MINRELIRIKAVQLVYACLTNGDISLEEAAKEMDKSLLQAYDLYHHMLSLICEVTDYAAQRYEVYCAQALERDPKAALPDDRFVANRFAAQLESNRQLEQFICNHKQLRWTDHEDVVHNLYDQITQSPEYEAYMTATTDSYEADRELWRALYKKYFVECELIDDALEEWSIYWNCDRQIIDSFVIKTIKRFEEENGDKQQLMDPYNSNDDRNFGRDLLVRTLNCRPESEQLIKDHIRNWELDRLVRMDMAVMLTALAEITCFPEISVNVSLNEYINIAKLYCTYKNIRFINATLDSIVRDLRTQGKLLK